MKKIILLAFLLVSISITGCNYVKEDEFIRVVDEKLSRDEFNTEINTLKEMIGEDTDRLNKKVDAKPSKKDIVELLNQCKSIETNDPVTTSCDEVCRGEGQECVKEDVAVYDTTIEKWIVDTGAHCGSSYPIKNKNEQGGLKLQCLCCNFN